MYPTLRATVPDGKVRFIENITLPENATLLVTVLDSDAIESLSLGEHLVLGLDDLLAGNVTEVSTHQKLQHLLVRWPLTCLMPNT
jgi:hypothetical protein